MTVNLMLIADERERERERERAVRWACVTGALIKWASLFVSWHRRFVFGRTDTDMLTDDGADPLLRRMYRVLERLTAQFIRIKYPCQEGEATTDRRGRGSEMFADVSVVEMP